MRGEKTIRKEELRGVRKYLKWWGKEMLIDGFLRVFLTFFSVGAYECNGVYI